MPLAKSSAACCAEVPNFAAPEAAPWINPKASARARKAAEARHASGRRRFVDPTTCEREYSPEEWEFLQAMQAYKQTSGRMFPTWGEVLEVTRELGYRKPTDPSAPQTPSVPPA